MADQAFKEEFNKKTPTDYGDTEFTAKIDTKEYKFQFPCLMDTQIRKLKQSLEGWKELILPLRNIFLWEEQWHPSALIGCSTVLFAALWVFEPNFLAVMAIIGLLATTCDYLIPTLTPAFFKPENWTATKEKQFEELCVSIILYKAKLELAIASYLNMRLTNKRMYFIITICVLSILAWIGCTVNNLLLAYFVFTITLLLPGMERNGILTKWIFSIRNIFADFLSQAKTRAGQIKND